jgi:hypothetical protein
MLNRKLILLLCLGMFLISFASATINVTILPPLEQPNLTLTRVPGGGTWTAGNYTFGIFSDASGTGAYGQVHSSYAGRVSNYTSATIELQTNDAVMLNWTVDPKTASIFIYKKGTAYYEDWSALYGVGFRNTAYPTGVTLTSNGFAVRGGGLQNFETDNFYFGMRPDKGMGQIRVNATQHFTTADIMDAIRNSSMIEGEDYIDMSDNGIVTVYSLDLSDTSKVYNFYINKSLLYFYGGIYSTEGARLFSNDGLGTTILSSKQGGYGNAFNFGNVTLIDVVINPIRIYYSKSSFYYGSYFGTTYVFSGTPGYSFVNSSYINSQYGGVDSEYFDSFVRTNNVNIQSATNIPTRQRTKTGYVQTYSDSSNKYINEQDYMLVNYYQILQTGNGNYDNYFLDCIFNVAYNNIGIVPVPTIYIYNYAVNYGINTIHIGNTVNIKVTNGSITNSLTNANVKLYDKDNNLIFNKTTDINGSIEEQEVYFFEISNKPTTITGIANTTNSNWTYYSPYTLVIEKEGYRSYNSTFNITNKVDWTIALEEETGSSGGVVVYSPSNKLLNAKKYPYLNYEISEERDTFSGVLTNPYIIKKIT